MTANGTGVQIEVNPEHLSHPTLAFLKSYWAGKHGSRTMPARGDIRPAEMKEHLGWVLLVDVLADASDFRFRTVGTRVAEYFLLDGTGKTVSEAFAPYGTKAVNAVLATHRKVAREGVVLRAYGSAAVFDRAFLDFDAIYLPLSEDGRNVNMILSAFTFDQAALSRPRPAG